MSRKVNDLVEGKRYRLRHDVERFPFFIAAKGLVGTIDEINDQAVYLKLDAPLDGLEEWDNCIQWVPGDGDDPVGDLEEVA